MRTVADFRALAERQWSRRFPSWLAGHGEALNWPLHPPTESEALASTDRVSQWAQAWQHAQGDDIRVEWVGRTWRSLGRQRLPTRVSATASAVARLSGNADMWERAVAAVKVLGRSWPETDFSDALPLVAKRLAALDEGETISLVTVLAWLAMHPASDLWERELPVEGVDSKWFEKHRAIVEPLLSAVTGHETGLRRHGLGFRVRVLDASLGDGPRQFTVDLAELSGLELRPSTVVVCENLTTVAALPEMDGAVAVHGMGFAAPSLAAVQWVKEARVWYWGDLDTYGLHILGQVRAALPHTSSILMDVETLTAHRGLAVREARPFRGRIGHLSVAELHALAMIREQDLRLEQERISREWAWPRLQAVAGRAGWDA